MRSDPVVVTRQVLANLVVEGIETPWRLCLSQMALSIAQGQVEQSLTDLASLPGQL